MVRAILLVGFGMALGYGASVARVAGKPLSHHVTAAWNTRALHHSLLAWGQRLPAAAHALLADSPAEVPRPTGGRRVDPGALDTDKLSDRDRRELDALLEKARRAP